MSNRDHERRDIKAHIEELEWQICGLRDYIEALKNALYNLDDEEPIYDEDWNDELLDEDIDDTEI